MALKKSDLYSSLWKSCDELRGGMDASQYKDYILTLLFVKYVSDKAKVDRNSLIEVPAGGSFDDMLAAKSDPEIGDKFNKIIGKLAEANNLRNVIDQADFNAPEKLGNGKELVDRLSKLVAIFADLDFRGSRAEGDDLLGDAYEYLMRHFATEAGKSKGQFYTPAEVSRILAKVVGIGKETRQDETVYDPACGSGSLLLKAAAEAPRGMTIYGQEKDNATWALSKMNMILHGNEIADIQKGDTLTSPQFTHGNQLDTFDYIVMNPPFSVKSWRNGLDREYGRFEYGTPPEKNGDYAFLLHALTSLKSRGKAAIILPHGVLFRGNAEATIRTKLLKQGFIKGIIGLPANLFYGTGIPACIVVLDKENAQARTGVFMIDASKGFLKDGNKNRLRDQDIHKIVDTFNRQVEIDRFSRMVPMTEIADPKNDYNLNIPRYIDSSEPEDLQDLNAHIHGGIPNHDLDLLSAYWDAFPSLRDQLFVANRPGYSDLKVEVAQVQQTILEAAEFKNFKDKARGHVVQWFEAHRQALETIDAVTVPNDLVTTLGDDLLKRFKPVALLDEYAVYQQLMSYWHDTMHDDVALIMGEDWMDAAKPRASRLLGYDKNKKPKYEDAHLQFGTGAKAERFVMDLIPPELAVARYLAGEQAQLDDLAAAADEEARKLEVLIEEQATEDGLLWDALDDKGKLTQKSLNAALRVAKNVDDDEAIEALADALALVKREASAKKKAKNAQSALDLKVLNRYSDLSVAEIKALVLDDKWQKTLISRVSDEVDALTLDLVARIQQLGERYASTVRALDDELANLESMVTRHLSDMGVEL
ncbi:type I restriction-modification system subunit M [Kocuria rhizophila]|uniref:type I restriction-modification system subunit M n=1 Tax=Kocuria rhizophila TaxID=72000 RepID=UPI0021A26D48|nr:type I restriction-modification system subunit M [Kocuria rhizophila]